MDNPEEVMQILERFSKSKQKEIPLELDNYLKFVATSGDVVYSWNLIKALFHEKLLNVITDFYNDTPNIKDLPNYPNVDKFCFETMKKVLLEKLDSFHAAPFTIQRICELLADPRKQYSRIDKFMRAIEKNILVVSTQEPGGRTRTESENGDSFNGDLSVDIEMGDNNYNSDPLSLSTNRTTPEIKDETEEPKVSSSPEISITSSKPDNLEEKPDETEKKPDEIDTPVLTSPIIAAIIKDIDIKELPDLPEEKDDDELESKEATATIEKLLEVDDKLDDLKLPPIETISPLPSIAAILSPTIDSLVDTSTSEDSTDCIVPVVLGLNDLKPEGAIPELAESKITENSEWLEWGDSDNADGSQPSSAKRLKIDNDENKVELTTATKILTEEIQEEKPASAEIQVLEKEKSTEIPKDDSKDEEPIEPSSSETCILGTPVEELSDFLAKVAEVEAIISTESELITQSALEDKLLEEPEVEQPIKSEVAPNPEVLETPETPQINAEIVEAPTIIIIPEIEGEAPPAIVPVEMEIATPVLPQDNKMSLDDDAAAASSLAVSIADEAELLMSPVISKMDTDGVELNEMDVDESSGEPMDQ